MTSAILIGLAALVVFAGWQVRRRTQRTLRGDEPVVTDEVLRRILREGSVSGDDPAGPDDEPLDEDEIRKAEDRFWEESEWDEPDEPL
jgi:hypothetical protein